MTQQNSSYTWAGRFSEPMSDLVKRYTASVDFDQRLWRQDINGSLAHARMLAKQGIIAAADLADIEKGMAQIVEEIESGKFEWSLDLEDVHLNIEKRLTTLVGDAGKRLHTGRSRNDQVATDIRLWLRDTIDSIVELIKAFQAALLVLAEKEAATPMPGSTHLQVAQPVTFGHHLLAYFEMTQRDKERFLDCRKRANRLPLGAAALAGGFARSVDDESDFSDSRAFSSADFSASSVTPSLVASVFVSPKLPPLAAVRAFESAARLENFSRAAEELGMTQAEAEEVFGVTFPPQAP